MNQRTRMFKTLGYLVGAMTGTSALLGWIDPSPPINAETPSFDAMFQVARSLVTEGVATRDARWRDVEILAGPPTTGSSSFLAATADRGAYHFHVDLDGRPFRTKAWPSQKTFDGAPHAVRIQVVHRGRNEPMSHAQWVGVQALIAALHEATGTATLPVRLNEEWAGVYGFDSATVVEVAPRDDSPV